MARDAIEAAYRANKDRKKAWSLPFDSIDPAGADDHFFYMRNGGAIPIVVYKVVVESTVAGTVEIHAVSGTAGGSPTAQTPVNKTPSGGPLPQIGLVSGITQSHYDDPDITGLTSGGILDFIALDAAGENVVHQIPEGIRLETGQALSLLWDTATGVLTGAVHCYEEGPSD